MAASRTNGFATPNLIPWHIKISFEIADGSKRPPSQGTFEEFWAAPARYKKIVSTSTFNQVEYATAAGIRRTGIPDSAPLEVNLIADQFLHPIQLEEAAIKAATLQMHVASSGETKLVCITAARPSTETERAFKATYCTEEKKPVLRLQLSGDGNLRIIRNGVVRFQDRYLPQTIEEYDGSSPAQRPLLTAKLEKIEALNPVDDEQFTPPADALPPPKMISLSESETKSHRLRHPFPQYDYQYPGQHRSVHMAGVVIIALRIQTDGHVSNLGIVAGPSVLRQASLDAVKSWTYKPFTVNGEPVEVNTSVILVYSITP